jgi:hypothetical protein
MSRALLSSAPLRCSLRPPLLRFSGATTHFGSATLKAPVFEDAVLTGANFESAKLGDEKDAAVIPSFVGADLTDVIFKDAAIHHPDFNKATLVRTSFTAATLTKPKNIEHATGFRKLQVPKSSPPLREPVASSLCAAVGASAAGEVFDSLFAEDDDDDGHESGDDEDGNDGDDKNDGDDGDDDGGLSGVEAEKAVGALFEGDPAGAKQALQKSIEDFARQLGQEVKEDAKAELTRQSKALKAAAVMKAKAMGRSSLSKLTRKLDSVELALRGKFEVGMKEKLKALEKGDAAAVRKKYEAAKSQFKKFDSMRAALVQRVLQSPTALDRVDNVTKRFGKVFVALKERSEALKYTNAKLTADLKDLQYLSKLLDKIDQPFTKETWLDVSETWMSLAELIPKCHAERCQNVLTCIFADDKVRVGLGIAEQFHDITGEPPHGVLLKLKEGPGSHIKKRAYEYEKALDKEMARIERIKELRTQMVNLMGTGIASGFIAIGTFIGRAVYNSVCTTAPGDGFFELKCD